MKRTYTELMKLKTFDERYNYLRLNGKVAEYSYERDRVYSELLYRSDKWKAFRRKIIIRDNGCDLGIPGREIHGPITVHHINPISKEDIINDVPELYDPENTISTSDLTHKAIHYSDENIIVKDPVVRTKNDTCPWKR